MAGQLCVGAPLLVPVAVIHDRWLSRGHAVPRNFATGCGVQSKMPGERRGRRRPMGWCRPARSGWPRMDATGLPAKALRGRGRCAWMGGRRSGHLGVGGQRRDARRAAGNHGAPGIPARPAFLSTCSTAGPGCGRSRAKAAEKGLPGPTPSGAAARSCTAIRRRPRCALRIRMRPRWPWVRRR
jgi:hypothetical protein